MSSAEGRSRIIAGKRLLQLLAIARFGRLECHIEGSRSSLHLVEVRFLVRISRVPEEGHARQVRYGFFQDLQPFRGQTGAKLGGPSDVASRLWEARDEPGGQGIACAHHDNGDRRRWLLRPGGERRGEETARHRREKRPSLHHSIT